MDTKSYKTADGRLERSETYDQGRLKRVDYYTTDDLEATKRTHLARYPGVPFALWQTLAEQRGYIWKYVTSFDANGTLTGFRKVLSDQDQRDWLQIEQDAAHKVGPITKYYWEDDELHYFFEYSSDGTPTGGFDLLAGEQSSLEAVRSTLRDPAFYADGYALPAALRGLPIPSNPL